MSDQSDQDYEDEDDEEDDTDYIDSEEGEMRDQSSWARRVRMRRKNEIMATQGAGESRTCTIWIECGSLAQMVADWCLLCDSTWLTGWTMCDVQRLIKQFSLPAVLWACNFGVAVSFDTSMCFSTCKKRSGHAARHGVRVFPIRSKSMRALSAETLI